MVCVPYVGPHNLIVQRWTQSFEYHGFFVLQKEFSCAYLKAPNGTAYLQQVYTPQLTTWIKKTHWILVVILQSPLIYMYQLWTLSETLKSSFSQRKHTYHKLCGKLINKLHRYETPPLPLLGSPEVRGGSRRYVIEINMSQQIPPGVVPQTLLKKPHMPPLNKTMQAPPE